MQKHVAWAFLLKGYKIPKTAPYTLHHVQSYHFILNSDFYKQS